MLACKMSFNRERAEDQHVSTGEGKNGKSCRSVIQRKHTAEGYSHHRSTSVNLIYFKSEILNWTLGICKD